VNLFDTQDLYDDKNRVSVINHFYSLSAHAAEWGYSGSSIATGAARVAAPAKSKNQPAASKGVSQQSMGSYGVDTGKDAAKLRHDVVRDPTQQAKYAEGKGADESETLGSLDRDLQNKIQSKYDPEKEREVLEWIEAVTGEDLGGSVEQGLHSGQVLCKLMNIMFPKSVTEISTKSFAAFQRENISKYLEACKTQGMSLVDLFDTQDLYDGKNMPSVINHFYALSSFARENGKKFKGPYIGVKLATKNERQFTDEQMRKGQFVPSGQTQGSYGVLDNEHDVKLAYQIVKNVDQIKQTQEDAQAKAKKMYG